MGDDFCGGEVKAKRVEEVSVGVAVGVAVVVALAVALALPGGT